MSGSAIASVCGTSRINVLNILKEIFLKAIEVASKQKAEITLDVRIGQIHIWGDSKKIQFEPFDLTSDPQRKIKRKQETLHALKQMNTRMSHSKNPGFDINQMLNSSALSTQSGGSMMISVKTPNTFARSTLTSTAQQKYSMFKG